MRIVLQKLFLFGKYKCHTNHDGTNITGVLSNYDIKNIYWKPDGNTIVFLNDDGIWNVKKDGTNLIKVSNFKIHEKDLFNDDYVFGDSHYYALYYNLVVYLNTDENVITERF